MTEQDILNALRKAYRRAGTQATLAESAGVSQGRIADYLNGRCSAANMSVATLFKFFPKISINFFGGKTACVTDDVMREQLLEIFNSLDERGKIRMVAMAAANFGNKLKEDRR